MVDHGIDIQITQNRDIGGFIRSRKQHDALLMACSTKALRVVQRRDTERVGVRECACDTLQAVTISIGLHDSHDPTLRRLLS